MVEQRRNQNQHRWARARCQCQNWPPCCQLRPWTRIARSPNGSSLFLAEEQQEVGAPGSRGGTECITYTSVCSTGGADAARASITILPGGATVLVAAIPLRDTGSSIQISLSRPPPRGRGAHAGNAGIPLATDRVAMAWHRRTHLVQHPAAQPLQPPPRPLLRPCPRSQ